MLNPATFDLLWFIAGIGAGALVGGLFAWLLASHRAQILNVKLKTTIDAERRHAEEKLKFAQETQKELERKFEQISTKILEDKGKRFTELNKENLEAVLKPLGERIGTFEKQVKETYEKETRDRIELKAKIMELQNLNQQIAEDAVNLTNALKGESKTRGNWGEMILARVFESSGLTEGREYELQVSAKSGNGGRSMPDAVVHLPDERDIVIDAKVSLVAYERMTTAKDEAERQKALKEHIASVRAHLKQLDEKDYHNLAGINSLDFVLMFIPVEPAYMEALKAEPGLFDEALKANIGLVSPSTLLPTLRTVENIWRYQQQSENAAEIARQAGGLYDKFVGYVEDLDKLGRALETAVGSYDAARNKLSDGRGNIVRRAERLKELGVTTSKSLPADMTGRAGIGKEEDA